ncbi:adenosylhomocysteinase [Streptomyces bacillaris]|uniref:Adenosylhomocysteinase n=1 Tax=Streptomyces cavourensis TaxID=67258 RepID=A0ABY5FDL6_9ACTN|nr:MULTISPECIES: adenosylhomocysteinase [Streptomyces]MBH0245221.1 hypothetical protein [Streptomyces cavourensis]NUV40297.1 adenosylhomocysteinase [Streptomyces sp. CAI-24]TQO29963.1 hypothetical protein FHX79_111777 [Streptomyces cavourensis]UTR81780.1 adenosylhomocysteinase [Streptomyces cavourensis]WAE65931.1 adenosylhomocysteinase [Streptomyces cavourensis]
MAQNYGTDVDTLPKHLDEKAARLHRLRPGAAAPAHHGPPGPPEGGRAYHPL